MMMMIVYGCLLPTQLLLLLLLLVDLRRRRLRLSRFVAMCLFQILVVIQGHVLLQ